MAKFKIEAGAELDLLNREELLGTLQSWLEELKRGVRFVRGNLVGAADGAGALRLGESGRQVGPAGSMVWAITRATVAGLSAAQTVDLYVNDTGSTGKLATVAATPGFVTFDATGVIFNPGDRLLAVGTGLTVNGAYTVNVQAVELPVQLAWQLLG